MSVCVSVELLTGSYDAARADDQRLAEWPPHPARLFCALVAAARDEADREALAWLESQLPPVVLAAQGSRTRARSAYVVTNTVSAGGGSQPHPGRTNGKRDRVAAVPAVPRVQFLWSDADPAGAVVEALDRMARRVPYLGRSSGVALVSASVVADDGSMPALDGCVVFEPCGLTEADVTLRVPYPGYLADLDVLFEADQPTWQAARFLGYKVGGVAPEKTPDAPSVYSDVVVLRFAGLRPEGRLAAQFTQALRRAVLGQAGDSAPPVLHGHGADGRPHVAFLALPHVGIKHADGHLLGLAVAVPDLSGEERRQIVSAVLGLRRSEEDGLCELSVRGIGTVGLSYEPGLVRPWSVRPERWRNGSTRWVTATPMVLDRFPRNGDEAGEVLRACRTVGLPDPVDIQVSREPLLPGAVRMRPVDLPERLRGRLFRHVALTFDRRVAGPVLVGAGRHLGVGLLAPVGAESDPDTGAPDSVTVAAGSVD